MFFYKIFGLLAFLYYRVKLVLIYLHRRAKILSIHTFCNKSPWWCGRLVIRWGWYLITARGSEESFLSLLLPVTLKAADLSGFDRGQNLMGRRFRTCIFKTARLVACSQYFFLSTYAKWMNDGKTISRHHSVRRPRVIKENRHRRLSRFLKQNRWQTLAQLISQFDRGPKKIISEHTVQLTLLDIRLLSKRPTNVLM